jgi:hypothetical protein
MIRNIPPYPKRILLIICLTILPAILTLTMFFRESIGWILGSLASAVNVILLAKKVAAVLTPDEGRAKTAAVKGYFLRYALMLVYAVIVILFVEPDILTFGAGLLAAQIAIYINALYEGIKGFIQGK